MTTRRDFAFVANGLSDLLTFRYAEIDGYWAPGVLCGAVASNGISQVEFDVLSGATDPRCRTVEIVAKHHRVWLEKRLLDRSLAEWIDAATVAVTFLAPSAERDYSLWPLRLGMELGGPLYRFDVRAVVTDDHGRSHVGQSHGWCWPHNPGIETRSFR
jgi:hypothetical protein